MEETSQGGAVPPDGIRGMDMEQTNGNGPAAPRERRWERWARGAVRLYHKAVRPGSEPRIDFSVVVLCAVVYGVLFFGIGVQMLPGHSAWVTLLLWACAHIGGFIAYQVYLPRVIGMLVSGIMLENIPWGATDGWISSWGSQMRAAALATIFLRCGLELDFGSMKRFKYPSTRLAFLPGLAEAFFDGGIASVIFGMPILLGFTLGFILKAVGPGLVVPEMFKLQKEGLGRDQGIPSIVVIAASFDDIIAITGYAIFSQIAIASGSENMAWEIAKGPCEVIFGMLGGLLAGVAIGCTRIFDTRLKRFVATYGAALLLMFFLKYWDMLSGGALGSLFVGLVASNLWERGAPTCLSLGPSFAFSPELERGMKVVWSWIMEPILFATIGVSINFDKLDSGTIPRSLVIIVSGVVLRMIVTYFAMSGFGYRKREKLFYAVAWTPKATVQAALSAAPLSLINIYKFNDPDYQDWVQWGNDILTTGIFAIIICGTLGVVGIHFLAPRCLEKAEEEEATMGAPKKSEASMGLGEQLPPGGASPFMGARTTPVADVAEGSVHKSAAIRDSELLAEYIDAVAQLTSLVHAGVSDGPEMRRLSEHVQIVRQQIESEIGQQEPSVRQLFQQATRMALARPIVVRRPLGKASPAVDAVPAQRYYSDDMDTILRLRSRSASALQERHSMQLPGRSSRPYMEGLDGTPPFGSQGLPPHGDANV